MIPPERVFARLLGFSRPVGTDEGQPRYGFVSFSPFNEENVGSFRGEPVEELVQ